MISEGKVVLIEAYQFPMGKGSFASARSARWSEEKELPNGQNYEAAVSGAERILGTVGRLNVAYFNHFLNVSQPYG